MDGTGGYRYWGEVTATVNWCEADYVVTDYVCEFFNTLTSIVMAGFGLIGVAHCPPLIENRARLAYLGLAVIGLGSAAFHGTLLYGPQLLDELPMLYGASTWLFVILTARQRYEGMESTLQMYLAGYSALATFLVIAFRYTLGAVLLPVAFGALVVAIGYHSFRIASRHYKRLEENGVLRLIQGSLLYFASGVFVWVLERPTCQWTSFLHFHSLWHLCSGMGGYYLCTWGAAVRAMQLGWQVQVRFAYHMFPYLILSKPLPSHNLSNA